MFMLDGPSDVCLVSRSARERREKRKGKESGRQTRPTAPGHVQLLDDDEIPARCSRRGRVGMVYTNSGVQRDCAQPSECHGARERKSSGQCPDSQCTRRTTEHAASWATKGETQQRGESVGETEVPRKIDGRIIAQHARQFVGKVDRLNDAGVVPKHIWACRQRKQLVSDS